MKELYIFISVHLSSSYIMLGKEFPIVVWSIDGKKYFLNLWILKLEVLLEDDRRYKNAGILKRTFVLYN